MNQTIEQTEDSPKSRSTATWLVAALIAATVTLISFAGAPTSIKTSFLYKDVLHLSASQVSTMTIIALIPAYLRPFMGALADLIPIFGYHRRSYYGLAWACFAAGNLGLAFERHYAYWPVVLFTIVLVAGNQMIMVIADAVMVAIGNQTGNIGRFQSLQQFIPMVLAIVGTSKLAGYCAQNWSYHRCFLVSGILCLIGLLFVALIPEHKVLKAPKPHEDSAEHEARLAAKRAERQHTKEALARAARTPGLWVMVLGTAQFYFSTNVLHFQPQFFGTFNAYGAAGSAVGVLLFAVVSRRLPVRSMVWGAFLMDCSLYLISMPLHDHHSAIVIAVVGGIAGMIYNLCLLTLAARACPPGIEGTIYGLVMSAITLAGALGDKLGSYIFDHWGPVTHHTVAYGWHTLLWFGFIFTVVAVIFIPFLPAWSKSNEPLHPQSGNGESVSAV